MNKKIIVWDIDGTVADTAHRLPLIKSKPKNWKAFIETSINDNAIEQTQFIYHALVDRDDTFTIVMTARGEGEREITKNWLQKNGFIYNVLLMRPLKDNRPDWQVKSEILDHIEQYYGKVFMAFEDRPGVIQQCYNAKGIFVLDVGQGVEARENMAKLHDDSDPVMAALSMLAKDGDATDWQRAVANAAMKEIETLRS